MSTSTSTPAPHPRTLLIIGLKPTTPNSTPPGNPWNSTAIAAALSMQQTLAASRNWDMHVHTIDPALTPSQIEAAVLAELAKKAHWDVVSVGYGVRGNLGLTGVFERVVNAIVAEVVRRKEARGGGGGGGGGGNGSLLTRFTFPTSPETLVEGAERVMGD